MKTIRVVAATADILRLFTLGLAIPIVIAMLYEPWTTPLLGLHVPRNLLVFLSGVLILTAVWLPVRLATTHVDRDLQDREAYLTVGIGWLAITVASMPPFMLSGVLTHPADAFFESMSGLTTTGATAIAGTLEDVAPSVMIWRALLQFIGGMGIIVLSVAVLARLTHGGLQLLQAETPGPSVTKVRPKLAQTAKTLWRTYGILSGVFFALLLALLLFDGFGAKTAFYEALLHTFTTLSTGGFSNHTDSIAYFDSWLVEGLIIVFMVIAGINFTLHYYGLQGDWKRMWRDEEWRFFMTTLLVSVAVVTGLVWTMTAFTFDTLGEAFRGASFTTVSILTSTGFGTVDFDQWPDAARLMLLIMMLTGATAGSTSGGMKHLRILIFFKVVARQLRKLLHPRAVIPIRLGGRVLKEETVVTTMAFFFSFITITLLGVFALLISEPTTDTLVEAVAAAASAMGNTGPALGDLGPMEGHSALLPHSKVLLAFMMWFGRLEVFTALLLFSPGSWSK